jgi:hypothetical protein
MKDALVSDEDPDHSDRFPVMIMGALPDMAKGPSQNSPKKFLRLFIMDFDHAG